MTTPKINKKGEKGETTLIMEYLTGQTPEHRTVDQEEMVRVNHGSRIE
jgi:hypothetical protein